MQPIKFKMPKKLVPTKSIKIPRLVSAKRIFGDIEFYKNESLKLGATNAVVLKTHKLPVDTRAVLKCRVPRCLWYGTCANCPPYSLPVPEFSNSLKKYEWALVFRKEVNPKVIVRENRSSEERVNAYRLIFKIVNALESRAFYDGYHFATGFAAGSCRSYLCGEHKYCRALKPGQLCRFPYLARSSMEAVGLDVFRLCTNLGWDMYPIGCNCPAEIVPHASLVGLLLII